MQRDPGDVGENEPRTHQGRDVLRLKRRADFLRVSNGSRWHGKAFTLQAAARDPSGNAPNQPRIGFTLTKKVGCSVVRNRARRRLREAIRVSTELKVRADHDYVVVGRIEAVRMPFDALLRELARGTGSVHDVAPRARHGGRTNAKQGRVRSTDPTRAGLERTKPQS